MYILCFISIVPVHNWSNNFVIFFLQQYIYDTFVLLIIFQCYSVCKIKYLLKMQLVFFLDYKKVAQFHEQSISET